MRLPLDGLVVAERTYGPGKNGRNGKPSAIQLLLSDHPEEIDLHPLVEMFPLAPKVDLFLQAEDIRRVGGTAKFLKIGKQLIDDRNRFEACRIAKVKIEFQEWDGFDSLPTTIARLNVPRSHLTDSQRAAIAVPFVDQLTRDHSKQQTSGLLQGSKSRQGQSSPASKTAILENPPVSLKLGSRGNDGGGYQKLADIAAQTFHVSRAYIELARKIRDEARDVYIDVLAGKLNLNQAKHEAARKCRAAKLSNVDGNPSKAIKCDLNQVIVVGHNIAVMKKEPAGKFTVAFEDGPYNNGWEYDSDPFHDKLPDSKFLQICLERFEQTCRLLAPNGSLFVMIDDRYDEPFGMELRKLGMHRRQKIVWYERFANHQTTKFSNAARYIHYYTKHPTDFIWTPELVPSDRVKIYGDRRGNPAGKIPDNVWEIPRLGDGESRNSFPDCPPQIPGEIPRRCIAAASRPGDWVLDSVSGNGTTVLEAILLGRNALGIERSPLYAEQSRKWIASGLNSTERKDAEVDPKNMLFKPASAAEIRRAGLAILKGGKR